MDGDSKQLLRMPIDEKTNDMKVSILSKHANRAFLWDVDLHLTYSLVQ